ncbi:MAG: hypothetical protein AB1679_01805 [Actinomycetota bacterium]|jgi:hypothetical protein
MSRPFPQRDRRHSGRRSGRAAALGLLALLLAASCSTGSQTGGSASPPVPAPPLPGPAARLLQPRPDQVANGHVAEIERRSSSSRRDGGSSAAVPVPDAGGGKVEASVEAFSPDGPVGGYARLLLRPDLGSTIRVEVVAQRPAVPGPATLAGLRQTLAEVTGKRVTVSDPMIIAGDGSGASAWTTARIRQLAPGPSSVGGPVTVRLAFLGGRFVDDDNALGVAVNASTAAVFTERARAAAGLFGDPGRLELAVATHELGHLLGLVDLVLDTGREDPEHPGHSPNRGSVMFWAVESSLVGTLLGGGPPTAFDAADRADLARIAQSSSPPTR